MPWNQTAKSDKTIDLPDGWQFQKVFSGPLEFKPKWFRFWKQPVTLNFVFSCYTKGKLKIALATDGYELTPVFIGEGIIYGADIKLA